MTGTLIRPRSARRPGGAPPSAVRWLYTATAAVSDEEIPVADPARHTMGAALDAYVAQRLPREQLDAARAQGKPVEVHGIYPYHLPRVLPGAVPVAAGLHPRAGKLCNAIRPWWFAHPAGQLVVAVPPGRDYVLHYASLIRHYGAELRQVTRYPEAERAIASWSGLGELVRPGDRILVGYVDELTALLRAHGAQVARVATSTAYHAAWLEFPDRTRVTAIGVRFSFWGCIAGHLVRACADRGAAEVIYAGKLGTLTGPDDVYGRLFIPSGYAIVAPGARPRLLPAPRNDLLAAFPQLGSGLHVSVATVLEEDLPMRAAAAALRADTVDNEIAQMALALGGRTAFSAIHFATDYLQDGSGKAARFNLANNRSLEAHTERDRMLCKVAETLARYYTRK